MKSLSLRMTEDEAAALERLAYIRGQSKNKVLTSLIVNEYIDIGGGYVMDTPAGTELMNMPSNELFGEVVYEQMINGGADLTKEVLWNVLKSIDYSLEYETDQKRITAFQDMRAEVMEMLIQA